MEPLAPEECKELLQASGFGVLALSKNNNAYAIPLFYAYDGQRVWFHCHPGTKDQFLESHGEACLVVSHAASEHLWKSVQVFGTPEKVTLTDETDAAKAALFSVPFPPKSGNYPGGLPIRTEQSMYYLKMEPSHIEGMKSSYKTTIQPPE